MPVIRLFRRASDRRRTRGQSLVELALVAPILLLILLFAIDFGRAYYSWIVLQNASRIGANFAGINADAWKATPDTPSIVAQYNSIIEEDADRAACDPSWGTGNPPSPSFTDSPADTASAGQTPDTAYDVGDSAKVGLSCAFHPFTPIIGAILSNNLTLSASSEFRIRAGDIAGLTNAAPIPMPSNATPTPAPTPTPTPTTGPTPTPTPACNITVNITRAPNGGSLPLNSVVAFNRTLTATGCSVASQAWTFAIGSPSTGSGPGPISVSYPNAGDETATLTVTSSTGTVVTDTETFRIRP